MTNVDGDTEVLDIADSCEAMGAADVDDSDEAVVLDSDDDVERSSRGSISGSTCKQWRSDMSTGDGIKQVLQSRLDFNGSYIFNKIEDRAFAHIYHRYNNVCAGYIRRGVYAVCGPALGGYDFTAVKTSEKLRSSVYHSILSDPFPEKQHGFKDEFSSEREAVNALPVQDSLGCNKYMDNLDSITKNIQGSRQLSTRKMIDENHLSGNKCESFDEEKGSTTRCSVEKRPMKLGENESQECDDLSQSHALGFVDHYLSLNSMNSLEKDAPGKTSRLRSPPVSRAKGPQKLARRTIDEASYDLSRAFDWNDDRVHKVEEHVFQNKDINVKMDASKPYNTKLLHNQKFLREMACTQFSNSGAENHRAANEVDQVSKTNFVKELDGEPNEERPEHIEAGDIREDVADTCDVGFNTQMAAEAMQALFYAPPLNFTVDHAHQDPGNINRNSSAGKEAHTNSKVALRKFKQKNQSSTELKGQTYRFSEVNRNELDPELRGSKCVKERKKRKSHSETVSDSMSPINLSVNSCNSLDSPIEQGKEAKALGTYNIKEADEDLISSEERNLHDRVSNRRKKRNLPSVAHRTRRLSTVQPLEETKYQLNGSEQWINGDAELGLLKRRKNYKTGDVLQFDTVGRKSETCFLASEKAENVKVSQKQQKYVNLASDCCQSKSDIWNFSKGKRKHRKAKRQMNGLSFFQKFPSVEGATGLSSSVGCPKKSNEKSSSCSKVYVRRKSRSPVQDHQVQSTGLLNVEECSLKQNLEVQSSTNALHGNLSVSYEKMEVPSEGPTGPSSSIQCPKRSVENPRSSCLKVYMRRKSSPLVHDHQVESLVELNYEECLLRLHSEVSSTKVLHGSFSFTDEKITVPSDNNFEASRICGSMESVGAKSPATGANKPLEKPKNANACLNGAKSQNRLGDRICSRVPLVKEILRLEVSDLELTNESKYPRRRRDMKTVRVLFSQNMDATIVKKQKKILGRLGSSIASSCSEATHFVADRFVRTRNMLEAIALGKPVVTQLWLVSCGQANFSVDEKNYILRDAKKEREIGFSMPVSLANARKAPLLKGRRVFVTPNIKPGKELIVSLVKAAHGEVLSDTEDEFHESIKNGMISDDILILSCEEDYALCVPLLDQGAAIHSSELLLNGIIVQKLEFERHRLFKNHL